MVDQPESMSDLPVEGAVGNSVPLPPGLTEEEALELQTELTKVRLSESTSSTEHCPYRIFMLFFIVANSS